MSAGTLWRTFIPAARSPWIRQVRARTGGWCVISTSSSLCARCWSRVCGSRQLLTRLTIRRWRRCPIRRRSRCCSRRRCRTDCLELEVEERCAAVQIGQDRKEQHKHRYRQTHGGLPAQTGEDGGRRRRIDARDSGKQCSASRTSFLAEYLLRVGEEPDDRKQGEGHPSGCQFIQSAGTVASEHVGDEGKGPVQRVRAEEDEREGDLQIYADHHGKAQRRGNFAWRTRVTTLTEVPPRLVCCEIDTVQQTEDDEL